MTTLDTPIALNLAKYGHIDRSHLERIEQAALHSIGSVGAREDIIVKGTRPLSVKLILEGWVARYKDFPDGRRQLLALMIPGDICDANAFILERMDHSLGALTPVTFARIGRDDFETLLTSDPQITRALWWSELITASIQREWTANIGQRPAKSRIAHLFCEMHARLQGVGMVEHDTFEFPLTQTDLGEATGLTPVHVNRTLQSLRKEGLIAFSHKQLTILDHGRLRELAMFDPAYLHGWNS